LDRQIVPAALLPSEQLCAELAAFEGLTNNPMLDLALQGRSLLQGTSLLHGAGASATYGAGASATYVDCLCLMFG